MSTKVFLLGPGYVGREVIDLLLADGKYSITTIVRREAAGKEFEKDGVKAVLGDLENAELIKQLAAESDVVFHTATADHLKSAQAILDGITARASQGKSTIYLHQSGVSVLSDGSQGNHLCERIFSDLTPDDLDALADDAPHRGIDLALVKLRKELGDRAKIFVVMPPIIYGVNKKYNRLSIQIPTLTRFAIKNGYAGYVGEGKSAWGTIHVKDVASVASRVTLTKGNLKRLTLNAYLTILHWLESSPPSTGLEHPYFFCESGETSWHDLSATIAQGLHRAGKISSATPSKIPEEKYGDLFGEFTPDVVGCNARSKADRLRRLGWKPKQSTLQQAFVEEDLPILLQEKEFIGSGLALA